MLRKPLIILYVISLLSSWTLCWGESFDFRHTRWGMTQKEVISAEEKMDPVERTENMIKYKTQILEKNVDLFYIFAQDKLIGSMYKLDDNYLNADHFIQTYFQFKQVLTKKYGTPSREITNWLNDTHRYNIKKWGLALSLGHIQYSTVWKVPSKTIECSLREENFNILCLVQYYSVDLSHLFEEVKKEDKIDLF